MASNSRVEFSTFDGTTLRGNLWLPKQTNAPVIIMVTGLTFLKEHVGDIPDHFCEAGFAVLAYDHRNWGSSEGTPRQHINLSQQSEDLSDAITFVSTQQPAIDLNKIFIWGVGHGGGVTFPVGATDPRVKAMVVWMPFISGFWDFRSWPKGHAELLWKERAGQASAGCPAKRPVYVPIFPSSLEVAKENPNSTVIGLPQIFNFYEGAKTLSDAAGTPWRNEVTIQSLFYQRLSEPTVFLPQLSIPLLYVTARKDEFTPHEKHMEAYEKVKGPKELLVLESENIAAVGTQETRDQAVKRTVDFLKQYS